jgi:hypothetical protein
MHMPHHREADRHSSITAREMRQFSIECLDLATRMGDANHRQMMVSTARRWRETADAIDRFVRDGRGEALPDLRSKLD